MALSHRSAKQCRTTFGWLRKRTSFLFGLQSGGPHSQTDAVQWRFKLIDPGCTIPAVIAGVMEFGRLRNGGRWLSGKCIKG
eukprot:9471254-Alexandrium_andersonii.AAC.1